MICFGSGYIEGNRAMASHVPSVSIKRVWIKADKRYNRQPKPGAQPGDKKCPYCPETFAKRKARKRHIIEAHADLVDVYKCPYCPKKFLEVNDVNNHVSNCRAKQAAEQAAEIAQGAARPKLARGTRVAANVNNPRRPGSGTEYQHPGKERQLDGSRGCHVFRDHGSFGSHPVHDDYGDESQS